MSNATHFKNSFATGEVSPFVHQSGSDLQVYQGSLVHCHNYIPLRTRALMRRPGTRVYHVFESDRPQRLLSFVVDSQCAYLLVLGDRKLQIFVRRGERFAGVKSLDIPYKEEEIDEIQVAQHTNTMWIVHPYYPPHQLIWKGEDWEFKVVAFKHTPQLQEQFIVGKKVESTLQIPFENSETGKVGIVEVIASDDVFKGSDIGRQLSLGWNPPAWKPDTWYMKNSYVTHDGRLFKCIGGGKRSIWEWMGYRKATRKGQGTSPKGWARRLG